MDRTLGSNYCINMSPPHIIRHSYAVESVMRALAKIEPDKVEVWGLAGLFMIWIMI